MKDATQAGWLLIAAAAAIVGGQQLLSRLSPKCEPPRLASVVNVQFKGPLPPSSIPADPDTSETGSEGRRPLGRAGVERRHC